MTGEECDCGLGDWPHPPHAAGLRTLPPTLCRLEYWAPERGEWRHGHAALNLLYPARYVTRLAGHGKIGRVTLLDSGDVLQFEFPVATPLCPYCDTAHATPYSGECLL